MKEKTLLEAAADVLLNRQEVTESESDKEKEYDAWLNKRSQKYVLTSESKTINGKKVYRIKAINDFKTTDGKNVNAGDLGGWIESEKNLDKEHVRRTCAWVTKDAYVMGNAKVSDGALITDNALVYGNAQISGEAIVSGNAKVFDDAKVTFNSRVSGNANVFNNAYVFGKNPKVIHVSGNAKVHGGGIFDGATISEDAELYGKASLNDNCSLKGKCKVFDNATISGESQVFGNAKVYDKAYVKGNSKVYGNAQVYGKANLNDNCEIYGNAKVYDEAFIRKNVKIYDNAVISGEVTVSNDVKVNKNTKLSTEYPAKKRLIIDKQEDISENIINKNSMKNKNKTLLEAATDMLLNRPQSTVSENISPSVLETLDLLSLHKILDKAFDVVGEKYSEVIDDDSDIEHDFRVLSSDIDDLLDMIADNKDNLYSLGGSNKLKVNPNIKEDEALDITGAVLEEISARCESIRESMKLIVSIEKLCNGILRDSYTDFNSTVMNVFGESTDKEELEEGTEMDDIAAKVAELKVGDKTNFGVVVDKSSNSVTFKGKDLPKTKITFNQRKMGSRDYVLSALRKIN